MHQLIFWQWRRKRTWLSRLPNAWFDVILKQIPLHWTISSVHLTHGWIWVSAHRVIECLTHWAYIVVLIHSKVKQNHPKLTINSSWNILIDPLITDCFLQSSASRIITNTINSTTLHVCIRLAHGWIWVSTHHVIQCLAHWAYLIPFSPSHTYKIIWNLLLTPPGIFWLIHWSLTASCRAALAGL